MGLGRSTTEFERGLQLIRMVMDTRPWLLSLPWADGTALAELKRTSDLNPGWQTANWDIWWALYASRRFDEAERDCRQAIKLDPNDDGLTGFSARSGQKHNYKAIGTFEKVVALNNSNLGYLADLGYARARRRKESGAGDHRAVESPASRI